MCVVFHWVSFSSPFVTSLIEIVALNNSQIDSPIISGSVLPRYSLTDWLHAVTLKFSSKAKNKSNNIIHRLLMKMILEINNLFRP